MSDTFLPLLVSTIDDKRASLRRDLLDGPRSNSTELEDAIRNAWQPLPPRAIIGTDAFAIDASCYCAGLSSGAHLVITQAVLVGNGGLRDQALNVAALPSHVSRQIVDLTVEAMMRVGEIDLAVRNLAKLKGHTVYLDGSLSENIFLAYSCRILQKRLKASGVSLDEIALAERVVRLYKAVNDMGVRLVSVAKTFQTSTLQQALAPRTTAKMGDALALTCWTTSAGYSTPILLGQRPIKVDNDVLLLSVGRSGLPRSLRQLPAAVAFYVRLADGCSPLRVETLASDWGLPDRFGDQPMHPCAVDVSGVLDQLRHDYVDDTVYNVPLVIADTSVRLHRSDVVRRYLPIIAHRLDIPLAFNRSERRFASLVS